MSGERYEQNNSNRVAPLHHVARHPRRMCDRRKMWIGRLCQRPEDFGAGGGALECASGIWSTGLNFRGDAERCSIPGWSGTRRIGKAQRRFDRPSSLGRKESRERDLRRAHVIMPVSEMILKYRIAAVVGTL